MATAHVITVGLSVLDALTGEHRLSAGTGKNRKPFGSQAKRALAKAPLSIKERAGQADSKYADNCWGIAGNARQGTHTSGSPLEQLGRLLCAIEKDNKDALIEESRSHTYLASAELQGFWLGNRGNTDDEGSLKIKDGDSVVFLVSDSQKGRIAAFWNAGLLANGDFSIVKWVDASQELLHGDISRHPIHVVVVPELHVKRFASFAEKLGAFARDLSNFLNLDTSERAVKLHLSGGYKVALPYFLAMGEWIASELSEGDSAERVSAFATHTDEPDFYVPLPLRRIPLYNTRLNVGQEIEMIRCHAGDSEPFVTPEPMTKLLLGYAYDILPSDEANQVTVRLTTVGRGYAHFLSTDSDR